MCANNPATQTMRANLKKAGSPFTIGTWPASPAPVQQARPATSTPATSALARPSVAGTKTLLGG